MAMRRCQSFSMSSSIERQRMARPGHEGRMRQRDASSPEAALQHRARHQSPRGRQSQPPPRRGRPMTPPHHGYRTIEFESAKPFQLAHRTLSLPRCARLWQRRAEEPRGLRSEFVGLLSRVHRMKGVIWFEECRRERWILQLRPRAYNARARWSRGRAGRARSLSSSAGRLTTFRAAALGAPCGRWSRGRRQCCVCSGDRRAV